MFANTLYPVTNAFLENVQEEVIENVKRLRNHASVVFWCGNNEILQGYREWGWYSRPEITWDRYHQIFNKLIPKILSEEDPDKSYIHSSPLGSQFGEMKVADVHYWAVWWGEAPIEYYKEKVGYFNSEFGMQSLLPMSSMKLFLNEEDMEDSESPGIIYHNKMANGNRVTRKYVNEAFKPWVEKSLEDYSYLTICTQAYGVGVRLESIRRAVPRSMGSLFWQFNDLWPVFSWSSIDYYG